MVVWFNLGNGKKFPVSRIKGVAMQAEIRITLERPFMREGFFQNWRINEVNVFLHGSFWLSFGIHVLTVHLDHFMV